MTFLEPWMLWGLPLLLLPVVIHLLNRLRHRSQPWAAMRFLLAATRSSTNNTRLRQLLVLLFRVLTVAALIFFLARPLAGGWVGWAVSAAPDAIVILLDRSASMESKADGVSKRLQALRLLATAAAPYEERSHLIVIDSATLAPVETARATNLMQLPVTQPTDTAADVPAMLRVAFNWLIENRAATAEIWIASDGQRSNWHPDDPRWKDITSQLASLSEKVRVRLLMLDQPADPNASVELREVSRRRQGGKSELQFTLDLQRNRSSSAPIPVTLTLDGAQSQTQVNMEGQSLRWRHWIDLGTHPAGGWGSFSLPADGNTHDNTAYFVYGPETPARAVVVSRSPESARYLQLAAASSTGQAAELLTPADLATGTASSQLDGCSLLIWQDVLPQGEAAARVQAFAEEGGVVMFFPPGQPDAGQFNGVAWGAVEGSAASGRFHVSRWNEEEGPLARSDEHLSLPLAQTDFSRRQTTVGQKDVLAAFEDGAALLARQSVGRGEVYFCSSLPTYDWSSLADGPVLVPMLQRLLQDGARRLQPVATISCGELSAADQAKTWTSMDTSEARDVRFQAGVYKSGERLMAVNRPASEDEPEIVAPEEMTKLFGPLPEQMFQDLHEDTSRLQGEIWRIFVFVMLLLLIGEALLLLPPRQPKEQPA